MQPDTAYSSLDPLTAQMAGMSVLDDGDEKGPEAAAQPGAYYVGSSDELSAEYRSPDEQLLEMIDSFKRMDEASVARVLIEQGEGLLGRFLDTHAQYMPDGDRRALNENIRHLETIGRRIQSQGYAQTGAGAVEMQRLMVYLKKTIPIVARTIDQEVRQRSAHGERDRVVTQLDARTDWAQEAAVLEKKSDIKAQIMGMREYELFQDLFLRSGVNTAQNQLEATAYQVEMSKREAYLWNVADSDAHGRFASELQKAIAKLQRHERSLQQLITEVDSSAATLRPDLRPSLGKAPPSPWRREGHRQGLALRGGGGGSPSPSPDPEFGVSPSASRSGSAEMMDLRPAEDRSLSRSESEDPTESVSPEGGSRERSFSGENRKVQQAAAITDDNFAQILLIRNPEDIANKFGVRARDVTDLYKTYGSQLRRPETVMNILKFLKHDIGLELDKAVPEYILSRILDDFQRGRHTKPTHKRIYPPGTTLRHVIRQLASGFPKEGSIDDIYDDTTFLDEKTQRTPYTLDEANALKLIGKGKTVTAVRKVRLLEIFRLSRSHSRLKGAVSILQLYEYRRVTGRSKIPPAVPAYVKKMGWDRHAMKLLYPMFGSKSVLTGEFFQKDTKTQVAFLRAQGSAPFANPNNWKKILMKLDGYKKTDFPKDRQAGAYTEAETTRIWAHMMKFCTKLFNAAGVTREDAAPLDNAMGVLMKHVTGMSPSPAREAARRGGGMGPPRPKPSPSPSLSRSPSAVAPRPPRSIMIEHMDPLKVNWAAPFQGMEDFGKNLLLGFEESFAKYAHNAGKRLEYDDLYSLKNNLLAKLTNSWENVGRQTKYLMPTFIGNPNIRDKYAFETTFLKIGYNYYISQLNDQALPHKTVDGKRQVVPIASIQIPGVISLDDAFRKKMFRHKDREEVENMLLQLVAAETIIHNMKTEKWKGSVEDSGLLDNLKGRLRGYEGEVRKTYQDAVSEWVKAGNTPTTFPVRDWEARLANHQWYSLQQIFGSVKKTKDETGKTVDLQWGEHVYDQQQVVDDGRTAKRVRERGPESVARHLGGVSRRSLSREPEPALDTAMWAADAEEKGPVHVPGPRDAIASLQTISSNFVLHHTGGVRALTLETLDAVYDQNIAILKEVDPASAAAVEKLWTTKMTKNQAYESVRKIAGIRRRLEQLHKPRRKPAKGRRPPRPAPQIAPIAEEPEPEDEKDPGGEQAAVDIYRQGGGEIERFYRTGASTEAYVPHTRRLRADVLHPTMYNNLAQVHLLQTDNNVQPVMGRVHMVKPEANFSDKHFMLDVDGDINEGEKTMVERSRRGPFREQKGASTIMDRSAHVMYRKRGGAFEITVRRGGINGELQQMLSKLSTHRMQTGGSRVVIIKGGRRYKLGLLTEIDLRYLIDLVSECVAQYGNCGLEITEEVAGRGPLYKKHVHSARFKSDSRRHKGAAHRAVDQMEHALKDEKMRFMPF